VGFKTLSYTVLEDCQSFEVSIIKKMALQTPLKVGVRTVDNTAEAGDDFDAIDKVITITGHEYKLVVKIIDDDKWEPDEDFYIELYDPKTGKRLQGNDTMTTVTIIDDARPGVLSFESQTVKVHHEQPYARLRVFRKNGSDGIVTVNYCTAQYKQKGAICAKPNIDFIPVKQGELTFTNGESERKIEIELLDPPDEE